MTSVPYLYIYNAKNTHEHTPNVSNNIESNASVATHLFMFEHDAMQNETDLLRANYTRSYKFEFYKCVDASAGSVECQPNVLQEVARDVLNDTFCPITCKVNHFLSHVVFLQWILIDCFQCEF